MQKLATMVRLLPDYEKALQLDTLSTQIRNDFAWLLATCPNETIRNPQRALKLALEECEMNNWEKARDFDTLAAAYASNENFNKAIEIQQRALELLDDKSKIEAYKGRLKLYENKKIFIDQE